MEAPGTHLTSRFHGHSISLFIKWGYSGQRYSEQGCGHESALDAKGLAHLSPVAAPKTGSCPWVGEQISQRCQEQDQCSSDSQCEGNKKCCLIDCAMKCQNPVLGMQPQDHPLGPFLPWLSLVSTSSSGCGGPTNQKQARRQVPGSTEVLLANSLSHLKASLGT